MLQDVISLTEKLVAIKSIAGNAKELEMVLEMVLSELPDYTIERFKRNGVNSALVYNAAKRPRKFKVILNGHLDVIPGKEHQYSVKIKGNRLYGVGAMDMKANIVCLMHVFKEMANMVNYPLGLQLVTDEEIGGFDGTKYQIEKGVRADFVIVGEPTNFDIVNEAKGIIWLRISAVGKTAHGAYPWRGENAIWKMNNFLSGLKNKYPIPRQEAWVTTINLSSIETSNHAFNKVPNDCAIVLDIRFIPEEKETIVKNIQQLLPKGFKVDILVQEPTHFINDENKDLLQLKRAVERVTKAKVAVRGAHGSSDARHFSIVSCAGVEFGPRGGGIGSDNEWVEIDSLATYCKILKEYLLASE